jgi:hypothetical protein
LCRVDEYEVNSAVLVYREMSNDFLGGVSEDDSSGGEGGAVVEYGAESSDERGVVMW